MQPLLAVILVGLALWWFSQNQTAVSAVLSGDALKAPDNWPSGDRIWDICRAIALAEGFERTNSAPFLLNNPGDLSPGDEHGYATAGPAEFHGGSYVIHFATPEDGWGALYAKFSNIVQGLSHVYQPDWTWLQIGAKYAADANWPRNVAAALGVDPASTVVDYVEAL